MKILFQIVLFLVAILFAGLAVFGPSELSKVVPLLPPLIAIGFAFITKNVLFSLFCGIYVGALSMQEYQTSLDVVVGLFSGVLRVTDTHLVKALTDPDHAAIIIFSMSIGGMVAVVIRSGGLQGLMIKLARISKSAASTQVMTNFMGIAVFFDDLANMLIVGNVMRPLSDKYRISREKLSFIIDSTAAPVASLALISTWIGYELGLIADALKEIGLEQSPYLIFLDSLPYRFYAVLLLFFIFASASLKKDFGPMLTAERRARSSGKVTRPGSSPLASQELLCSRSSGDGSKIWLNAAVPIFVLVLVVLGGLYVSGYQAIVSGNGAEAAKIAGLRDILGQANSFSALMWGAILSSIVALKMVVWQRILSMDEAISSWMEGVKSMLVAMVILCMAWALGGVLKELNTAETLTTMTVHLLKPSMFPMLIFVLSSVVSFATGTSWGTMAIIFPLAIPMLHKLVVNAGLPPAMISALLASTVGGILTGATFGDHCSPISDTTIMSSMFAGVDHMDHVRTQLVYALVVGGISAIFCYLPAGFGLNPYLLNGVGIVLVGALYFIGKDPASRKS